MSPAPRPALLPLRAASLPAKLVVGFLAAAVALLSWRLWPEWRQNPDLSHGLFMPVLFLLLLRDSCVSGTRRFVSAGWAGGTALAALLFGSLLALGAAGLYAAALGWSHALVNFMLTASLVLLLGAALLGLSGEAVRLIPLNWPACIALVLWLLSSPMPHGMYSRLTLGLQLWVSQNVLRALHLLGIPALRHGNVIELANGSVGIEEACSGVRSLISCVFAGLFFSATLVRRPSSRALLIVLAVPLALAMNFLRSLLLTLLANRGVNIAGTWHDVTGFAVLGVTAVLLAGLALLLERREKTAPAPSSAAPSPAPAPAAVPAAAAAYPTPGPLRLLIGGVALAAALVVVFVVNTRPAIRQDAAVPNLYSVLPAAVPGWTVDTSTDLYQFADLLQTDYLAQRTYLKQNAEGQQVQVTLYAAYWRAGQAAVSLVASHTPDACWPGSGWEAVPRPAPAVPPTVAGRTLAAPEYRLFKSGQFPQHVWFWHLYDGRPIAYRDPYSATELLRIAWRYGFRHDGDQLFVRISSNAPWSAIAGEPLLAQFFAHTQALGL
ncbi:MAG: exosortase/archaeosortase family protein [Verrucomicrobia bacterium]|nr:exosortase/archaeosortase family protein [Verrucomicrobiota bacterium]